MTLLLSFFHTEFSQCIKNHYKNSRVYGKKGHLNTIILMLKRYKFHKLCLAEDHEYSLFCVLQELLEAFVLVLTVLFNTASFYKGQK